MESREVVIGVDVGTGSARAGTFARDGGFLGKGEHSIGLWRSGADFVEQSSADIWMAVIAAVAEAKQIAGACTIPGIRFDAACTLVVLGEAGKPISMAVDDAAGRGGPVKDVIVWMDQCGRAEVAEINETHHLVLRYLGGRISPEMQTPNLLWLSRHRHETFARACHFFDLPDSPTWRATGAFSGSLCPLSCKWAYLRHELRGDETYFGAIGLGVLAQEGFRRIGTAVRAPGAAAEVGLSESSAAELGFGPGQQRAPRRSMRIPGYRADWGDVRGKTA